MSDILEALQRDRHIIVNSTIDEYRASTLTKNPLIYGDYARFERVFYTIKNHPEINHTRELWFPHMTKSSELFEYFYIVNDGVGNDKMEPRIGGTNFIHCSTRYSNSPLRKQEADFVKGANKPFVHTYARPTHESLTKHLSYSYGAYELFQRGNKWLIELSDSRMMSTIWLAIISDFDTPYITK